jgi:predicted anti-sigma-YlaC factor YlaD
MNCTQAREALLVADLAELRGETETPLAAHIGGCSDCRRLASVIAGGTAHLGSAIAHRGGRRARISRRAALLWFVPVAAAVVLAVSLNVRSSRRDAAPRVALDPLPVARTVSLEVGRGQRATVLKTADPKVTVIWLSSGEGK